jgi:hypothetical protein
MSGSSYYKIGDHNIICDYSGFKIKRSDARRTWDGYLVDKRFWEPRQPQDFVRGRVDKIAVPPNESRSESPDTFITSQVLPEDL